MSVLAVIGTYWHRIDTIVCFSEGWKSGFVPCNFNKVQACTPPYSLSSFGQLGHRETMLLEPKQQHKFQSVCWRISCAPKSTARCPSGYPKAFRLLPKSGSSKVCFELLETFRVTPENLAAGLPLRSRATCSNLRCSYPIPCTLCRTILSCCKAWYARCRAMPPPTCGCLCLFQGMDDLFLLHIV